MLKVFLARRKISQFWQPEKPCYLVHKIVFTKYEHCIKNIQNSEIITSEEIGVEEPIHVHYISKSLFSLSSSLLLLLSSSSSTSSQYSNTSQPTCPSFLDSKCKFKLGDNRSKIITRKIAYLICKDNQPFSIVEDKRI